MTLRCRPYFKRSRRSIHQHLAARAAGSGPWTVPALCAHYGLQAGGLPGGGTIGILELGGGWTQSDVTATFAANGMAGMEPKIKDVSVDGTQNLGAGGGDASTEVMLDLIAAMVYSYLTGKKATVDFLWSQGIDTAAIKSSQMGHASCSCSWGDDEPAWGATDLASMQAALVTCTGAGTSFFAASGDNDGDDNDGTGKPSVDAPASCTNAIACGGTSTPQSGASVIWNNNPGNASGEGTGGGYSATFPWQSFCTGPTGPGRMVSDVAGNADPDTGFEIVVGGQSQVVGGTSAVSPFWAGIRAALGPQSADMGFINAKLWALKAQFVAVTSGTNGVYPASVCCGLGIPTQALLTALAAAVAPPAPPPTPPTPTGLLTAAQVTGVQTAVSAVIDPQDAYIEKVVVGPELQAAVAALGPIAS